MKKIGGIFLLTILAACIITGCTPGSRKILSFFFDGVPAYYTEEMANTDTSGLSNRPGVAQFASTGPDIQLHIPFKMHNCGSCHDNENNASKLKPQPASCYACHDSYDTVYAVLHGPVAGGYCSECHAPHKTANNYLLKRSGQALCLNCHSSETVMRDHANTDVKESECTACHNPHGGANRFLLKQ